MDINHSICVVCLHQSKQEAAQQFAQSNSLALRTEKSQEHGLQLIYREHYIELFDTTLNTGIYVDFVEGALAHRQRFGGGLGQSLAKAIGIKQNRRPHVLDATAGLARDAYIMASLGCNVTLIERSPILVELLEDGIKRGASHEPGASILKNNFKLIRGDSIALMEDITPQPDVIYIDPMYPKRTKSAMVKKDMRILQKLLGKDQHPDAILLAALKYARSRVVIKRPRNAIVNKTIKPASSITGKTTRYDIYPVS